MVDDTIGPILYHALHSACLAIECRGRSRDGTLVAHGLQLLYGESVRQVDKCLELLRAEDLAEHPIAVEGMHQSVVFAVSAPELMQLSNGHGISCFCF